MRFLVSLTGKRSFATWASDDAELFECERKELIGSMIAAFAKLMGLAGGKAAPVEAPGSAYAGCIALTAPADDARLKIAAP